jgi:hypothetical protein
VNIRRQGRVRTRRRYRHNLLEEERVALRHSHGAPSLVLIQFRAWVESGDELMRFRIVQPFKRENASIRLRNGPRRNGF